MKLVIDIPDEEYELDKWLVDSGMGSPAICRILDGKPYEEPKKGKWIKDIYGNVVCSECRANRRDNRIGHIAFCNSCGAKMEVDE